MPRDVECDSCDRDGEVAVACAKDMSEGCSYVELVTMKQWLDVELPLKLDTAKSLVAAGLVSADGVLDRLVECLARPPGRDGQAAERECVQARCQATMTLHDAVYV